MNETASITLNATEGGLFYVLDGGAFWGSTTGAGAVHLDSGCGLYYVKHKTDFAGAAYAVGVSGNHLPWSAAPVALSWAVVAKLGARVPDALEGSLQLRPRRNHEGQ